MTEQLKALAMAAKVIDHNENEEWYEADMLLLDGVYYPKNAQFIAAASPDVVLGLLAEIENLKAYAMHERSLGAEPYAIENNDLQQKIDADEALMREAMYALDYAADMTKPEGMSGCDCPICTVSRSLAKRLENTK